MSKLVPALDPEGACRQAIEAGLVVRRAHPLNCETSIQTLVGGVVIPNTRFYVRKHFPVPNLDAATFRLAVRGLVERPLMLSMRHLRSMPSETRIVMLECAGNGRALFHPAIEGEKWTLGAVSTAEWTGVPLAEVLDPYEDAARRSVQIDCGAAKDSTPLMALARRRATGTTV